MTDRPAPPSGGGMTEATGSLTPDDSDESFVPAELRAINRPEIAHAATVGARQRNAEEHSQRPLDEIAPTQGGPGTRLGGDELHTPEDEHF